MTEPAWILNVVERFYSVAKNDVLIGYHFRFIKDFEEHIPRIASFWDLQLLGKTERAISPPFDVLGAHRPLGIKRGEIGRWLTLFQKTLAEEINKAPQFKELAAKWEERLQFFEGVFLRSFGTKMG